MTYVLIGLAVTAFAFASLYFLKRESYNLLSNRFNELGRYKTEYEKDCRMERQSLNLRIHHLEHILKMEDEKHRLPDELKPAYENIKKLFIEDDKSYQSLELLLKNFLKPEPQKGLSE